MTGNSVLSSKVTKWRLNPPCLLRAERLVADLPGRHLTFNGEVAHHAQVHELLAQGFAGVM